MPRIALVLQSASGYGWKAALGVRAFARQRPSWELRVWEPGLDRLRGLAAWSPDGVVGYLPKPGRWRVPVVTLSQAEERTRHPLVTVDNRALGAEAARFLASLGRLSLVVTAATSSAYARLRKEGFLRELQRNSHSLSLPQRKGVAVSLRNARWLDRLPKPAAVFACDDLAAAHVARRCAERGLLVPEDVALLGADNEPDEAISSIGIPAERIGYEAAALLDRLLKGGRPPRRPILLAPLPVVERASTGAARGVPKAVAAALAFIAERGPKGLGVEEVARHAATGRRTLERLFRKHLGTSVYTRLRSARAAPLRRLLAETAFTLEEIAARQGFHSAQHLSEFFRGLEGVSPGAYRARFRSGR